MICYDYNIWCAICQKSYLRILCCIQKTPSGVVICYWNLVSRIGHELSATNSNWLIVGGWTKPCSKNAHQIPHVNGRVVGLTDFLQRLYFQISCTLTKMIRTKSLRIGLRVFYSLCLSIAWNRLLLIVIYSTKLWVIYAVYNSTFC